MHICFLCNEYPPLPHGGVGSVTHTLAHALLEKGQQVTVLGIDQDTRSRAVRSDQGIEVIRCAHARLPHMGFLVGGHRLQKELDDVHRRNPIDVLEGSEGSMAFLDPKFPATRVIRMHGGHHFFAVPLGRKLDRWRSWQEKKSFRAAQHLCAVSTFVAEKTRQLLKLEQRKITVIPNPVNTNEFYPAPADLEESGKLVYFGALAEKKGIRQLLAAMPRVLSVVPHATLTVAGRDTVDPETHQSYLRTIEGPRAALGDRVRFIGAIPRMDLRGLISTASVCVLPSHMEALPMAWLEVMAMGKPLVASTAGPGSEVVEDSVSGLLCNPHDPEAIAWKIIELLTNPHRRVVMGRAARQRVERHFSLDLLVQKNLEFYESCCLRYKRAAAC